MGGEVTESSQGSGESFWRERCQKNETVIFGLRRERDALARFKAYVHRRLDEAGIPADPESPHKAAGCRIGGRLDIVLGHFQEDGGWVDVRERLPTEEGRYLAAYSDGIVIAAYWTLEKWGGFPVIHWRPLPAPPSAKEAP